MLTHYWTYPEKSVCGKRPHGFNPQSPNHDFVNNVGRRCKTCVKWFRNHARYDELFSETHLGPLPVLRWRWRAKYQERVLSDTPETEPLSRSALYARPPVEWVALGTGVDACWLWRGALDRGYGRYERTSAQRAMYRHFHGPIPEGMDTDHLCRNPSCVNPLHLEVVTNAENNRRAALARWVEREYAV